MTRTMRSPAKVSGEKLQLATFYLGNLCLALEIGQIQEIMREVRITHVPHAPPEVSGVINLRGEVSTIIDLRRVLGLPPAPADTARRTLVVRAPGESIGLVVDRVADITAVDAGDVTPPPPNIGKIDGRLIRGVYPCGERIIAILHLEQTLALAPVPIT